MVITPAGHYLGRKPDSADPRDRQFKVVHVDALITPPPPRMDLREQLPPAFDQGDIGSCGPNSGTGMMAHQFPELKKMFSRNQVYYGARLIQNDVAIDDGVETRNILKVLTKTGAAFEASWPYGKTNLFKKPPVNVIKEAAGQRLLSYSRLNGEDEYLCCLADGFTFILGFTCFGSIDSPELARTGVMPVPDPKKDKEIGGHDVLVVGYETNFKSTDVFRKSRVDPALVEDTMLLIRNSWGTLWGDAGHFWMPMSYAVNTSIGGDAWTGRRYAPVTGLMAAQRAPSVAQLQAGTNAARSFADESGYGGFISDDQCQQIASVVGTAVINTK